LKLVVPHTARGNNQDTAFLFMASHGFYNFSTADFQGAFGSDLSACTTTLGDYYREEDDVVRGLSLPVSALSFSLYEYQQCTIDKVSQPMLPEFSSSSDDAFVVAHVPPALSRDVRASLQSTIVESESSPVAIGNRLLSFLGRKVDAKINKMGQEEFTIQAEAFMATCWCSFKVRIYKKEDGSLMEFQKRSGDSLAFVRLFREAKADLLGLPCSQAASPSACQIPDNEAFPQLCLPAAEEACITPLLDMAHGCQDISILAEVASALHSMASDPAVAAALCLPCALAVLQQLRQVEDFRVQYPMTSMLTEHNAIQISMHSCIQAAPEQIAVC
jgi:hypothetical protein